MASGAGCQDDARVVRIGGRGVVAVVADGAGSARMAQLGARIATDAAASVLSRAGSMAADESTAETLLDRIGEDLAAAAANENCALGDFATTLLAVRAKASGELIGWTAFHIGDGLIAAELDGELCVLSPPENGEFGNSTFFVTDPGARQRFRSYQGTSRSAAFALMTDGAAECLYHRSTASLAPAVSTLIGWSKTLPPRRFRTVLRDNLSKVIATKTTDDATLAIISIRSLATSG